MHVHREEILNNLLFHLFSTSLNVSRITIWCVLFFGLFQAFLLLWSLISILLILSHSVIVGDICNIVTAIIKPNENKQAGIVCVNCKIRRRLRKVCISTFKLIVLFCLLTFRNKPTMNLYVHTQALGKENLSWIAFTKNRRKQMIETNRNTRV